MRGVFLLSIAVLFVATGSAATADGLPTVTGAGWSVTVDGRASTFSVSRQSLGLVLTGARLNLRGPRDLIPLKGWSVKTSEQNQLAIRTSNPTTDWLVALDRDTLKISCTSSDAVLTAQAPAPANRMVARVLDPQGVPVNWMGTNEAKASGGVQTSNQSFLPRRNPECMYFALGQVSSANLHSLFDRPADAVIDFSEQTRMQRHPQDQNLLDVVIPVPGNTVVRILPEYYTQTLGVPSYVAFDDTYWRQSPMLWSDWDNYYAEVREEDIVQNADWIAAHLKPYGIEYICLDDGYDRGEKDDHHWIARWNKERFPHGPQWLTDHIKAQGLRAGLWLVPNAYAGALEEHPDWCLWYKNGQSVRDYSTSALDSTNPAVLAFLKKLFTTLDDWGFDYYKFDGEYSLPKYLPGIDRDRLYDKSIDSLDNYRARLQLIRDTIGPRRFIEGCPAGTPLNGIGYFNSYFNGSDMYTSWRGQYALFSAINGNAFLNHIVVYVMPGEGIEVGPVMSLEEARTKRMPTVVEAAARTREDPRSAFGTTLSEAHTLVSYLALTGVAYPIASVMPELPDERVRLLKMTLPTLPIFPIDLFSRGTDAQYDPFEHVPTHFAPAGLARSLEAPYDPFNHLTPDEYIHNYPEILDLKVNAASGVYDVVGLTNWRSWATTRELDFAEKLGLDRDSPYVVFDYWDQKLLGVFQGRISVGIEPHDTRVLLIHPAFNRPQLVGTSRHITGAYSIRYLTWENATNRLRGTSETVPSDDYALWFYVPKGLTVRQVRATAGGKGSIPVRAARAGESLEISFAGQQEPVDWEVAFTGAK